MFGINFGFKSENKSDFINFVIIRSNSKNINVSVHKEHSLWDLYEICYHAVYPNMNRRTSQSKTSLTFSGKPTSSKMNKFISDDIPNTTRDTAVIYDIFVSNDKMDNILSIPVNKFIKISSFMDCNPDYFNTKNRHYKLFVVDENILHDYLFLERKESLISSVTTYVSKKLSSLSGKQEVNDTIKNPNPNITAAKMGNYRFHPELGR